MRRRAAASRRAGRPRHDARDDDRSARRRRHSSRVLEQQEAAARSARRCDGAASRTAPIPDGAGAIAVIDEAVAAADADVMYTPRAARHATRTTAPSRSRAWPRPAACRRVLYYETPSTQCFEPTVYVEIGDVLDEKLAALARARVAGAARADRSTLEAIEAAARSAASKVASATPRRSRRRASSGTCTRHRRRRARGRPARRRASSDAMSRGPRPRRGRCS